MASRWASKYARCAAGTLAESLAPSRLMTRSSTLRRFAVRGLIVVPASPAAIAMPAKMRLKLLRGRYSAISGIFGPPQDMVRCDCSFAPPVMSAASWSDLKRVEPTNALSAATT